MADGITDEMVETAARAACAAAATAEDPDQAWTRITEGERAAYRDVTRAALTAGLAGRAVVDLPKPIAFQDEHTDVKTWEPDGVDFQVNLHPADCEKDVEVSFAYWQISPHEARGVGAAFLAAAEHHDRQNSEAAGGVL